MRGQVITSATHRMYNPAHPGEIIQEYMEGLDLTVSALAAHLRITRANLSRMIHGKTGVSAEWPCASPMHSELLPRCGSECRPITISQRPRASGASGLRDWPHDEGNASSF